MHRVLHLIDDVSADLQTRRSVQALRQLKDPFVSQTAALGSAEFRNIASAAFRLREREDIDLIHAWGPRCLMACALSGKPVVFTPSHAVTQRMLAWLRAQMAYRNIQVICPTATLRRRVVKNGIALERCHLIRPGVEFRRIRPKRDAAELRAKLGFAPGDVVTLAIGESTRSAAHEVAVWAVSILHVMDTKYRLLLWGRGERTSAATQFASDLGQSNLLVNARQVLGDVDFEQILPAADVAVASATGPVAPLATAICMAAAIPIVSSVTYTLSELLEDHHNALLAPPNAPRALAQRILDLRSDSSLQWRLADVARTEAFEYFSQTRFLEQHRNAYAQVLEGKKVEIPETAPGAGSRFHGRG